MNVKELTLTAAKIGETKLVQLIRRETKKLRANSDGTSRLADLMDEILLELNRSEVREGHDR